MKIALFTLTMILFTQPTFAGDVLTTNDNKVFEGKVTKIKDCSIVFKAEGKKYEIPAKDIHTIRFEHASDKVYTEYLKLSDSDADKCLQGSLDAEFLHGKKWEHVALGVLFGPFALVGTALSEPSPKTGTNTYAESANKDIFDDPEYLSCYRKTARKRLAGKSALGWAASAAILSLYRAITDY